MEGTTPTISMQPSLNLLGGMKSDSLGSSSGAPMDPAMAQQTANLQAVVDRQTMLLQQQFQQQQAQAQQQQQQHLSQSYLYTAGPPQPAYPYLMTITNPLVPQMQPTSYQPIYTQTFAPQTQYFGGSAIYTGAPMMTTPYGTQTYMQPTGMAGLMSTAPPTMYPTSTYTTYTTLPPTTQPLSPFQALPRLQAPQLSTILSNTPPPLLSPLHRGSSIPSKSTVPHVPSRLSHGASSSSLTHLLSAVEGDEGQDGGDGEGDDGRTEHKAAQFARKRKSSNARAPSTERPSKAPRRSIHATISSSKRAAARRSTLREVKSDDEGEEATEGRVNAGGQAGEEDHDDHDDRIGDEDETPDTSTQPDQEDDSDTSVSSQDRRGHHRNPSASGGGAQHGGKGASLLQRSELACGSIRATPGTKQQNFRSVIRCGSLDPATQQWLVTMKLDYFGKEMDVYTADCDTKLRPLVRASTLADKFNCATNKIGMYLARRRTVMDGIYQATEFTHKPPGKTGLKVGGYFLTLDSCKDFEIHYWQHKEKKHGNGLGGMGVSGLLSSEENTPEGQSRSLSPSGSGTSSSLLQNSLYRKGFPIIEKQRPPNTDSRGRPKKRVPKPSPAPDTPTTAEGEGTMQAESEAAQSDAGATVKPIATATTPQRNGDRSDDEMQSPSPDSISPAPQAASGTPESMPALQSVAAIQQATSAAVPAQATRKEFPSVSPDLPVVEAPPATTSAVPSILQPPPSSMSLLQMPYMHPIDPNMSPNDMHHLYQHQAAQAGAAASRTATTGLSVRTVPDDTDPSAPQPPRSPPSTSVLNNLAIIRQSLESDAERKRNVFGGLTALNLPGPSTTSSLSSVGQRAGPNVGFPHVPVSSPVYSFLRPTSLAQLSASSSAASSPLNTPPSSIILDQMLSKATNSKDDRSSGPVLWNGRNVSSLMDQEVNGKLVNAGAKSVSGAHDILTTTTTTVTTSTSAIGTPTRKPSHSDGSSSWLQHDGLPWAIPPTQTTPSTTPTTAVP